MCSSLLYVTSCQVIIPSANGHDDWKCRRALAFAKFGRLPISGKGSSTGPEAGPSGKSPEHAIYTAILHMQAKHAKTVQPGQVWLISLQHSYKLSAISWADQTVCPTPMCFCTKRPHHRWHQNAAQDRVSPSPTTEACSNSSTMHRRPELSCRL